MIFTRKYKPGPIKPLKLWGKEITYANSVKYLGVTLNAKLRKYTSRKRGKHSTRIRGLVEELWARLGA